MPRPDRHALLADPTRRAILDGLASEDGPLDVRTLAGRLGLHANSVRDQLRRLEAAGMVRAAPSAPAGRGRPRLLYVAVPGAQDDPYRSLATALADEIVARPDAVEVGVAAGDRWGRAAAREAVRADVAAAGPEGSAGPGEPVGRVLALLDDAGFAPEPLAGEGRELRLRACPFLPIEPGHAAIVCGVHLGFIRGALEELGSPVRAVAIEPFAGPDLCIARLGPARG